MESFGEVAEVEGDVSILIGDIVGTDEIFMVEVINQQRNIESVHLVYYFISNSLHSCLIVQHLQKDLSFIIGDVRTCILNDKLLSERQTRNIHWNPLQIPHRHLQGLCKVGRVQNTVNPHIPAFALSCIAY